MFGLGFTEIIVVLVVCLLVFGPERLPELSRTLGRAMGQLRRASDEFRREVVFPSLHEEARSLRADFGELQADLRLTSIQCPEDSARAEEEVAKTAAEIPAEVKVDSDEKEGT